MQQNSSYFYNIIPSLEEIYDMELFLWQVLLLLYQNSKYLL